MSNEHVIRLVAGLFVLTGLTLGVLVSHYWLLLCAFVGLNLAQSALTNFCPLELVLRRLRKTPALEPGR